MNVLTDLFASAVQLYPGQMFPVLYIFYFSSLIPLRMAISLQCEPVEQSESERQRCPGTRLKLGYIPYTIHTSLV